ncbi:phosphatidylethanolamine-binding protein 1-like [Macrobrachium nipponense]|uniref:phosphatidylethanolamine-binding protein 1-like n=1 Tax=Macrobrachium nipponense TaxID=159736 RepID=UPI0030C88EC5
MIDPDAPSRQDPTLREFLHWIIGNMPCCSLGSGEIQAQYFPAGPPKGTGLHRYALLVFRQPEYIIFHEPALTNRSFEGRPNFSTRKFADKYELKLVAGNFFQAEYDPTVDELYRMVEQQ